MQLQNCGSDYVIWLVFEHPGIQRAVTVFVYAIEKLIDAGNLSRLFAGVAPLLNRLRVRLYQNFSVTFLT